MRMYRVLVIGMGKRGLHHATFFKANPRFELIGISSRDSARLQGALFRLMRRLFRLHQIDTP